MSFVLCQIISSHRLDPQPGRSGWVQYRWRVGFDCGHAATVGRSSNARRPRRPQKAPCPQCSRQAEDLALLNALERPSGKLNLQVIGLFRGEWCRLIRPLTLGYEPGLVLPSSCLLVACDVLEEKDDERHVELRQALTDGNAAPVEWVDVSSRWWLTRLPEIWAAWQLDKRDRQGRALRGQMTILYQGLAVDE